MFITEGEECAPAAEIQFSGQRLCIVRLSSEGPMLDFGVDGYKERPPLGSVPAEGFAATVELAVSDLAAWSGNLTSGPEEA